MKDLYRVLAIDYGTKRVGIALSDELRMLATPKGVILNSPKLLADILALVERENVQIVILGIPKTLSNDNSAMTSQVLKFKDTLGAALETRGVELRARDERLTSVMANFNISQRGLPKHKREDKALRDEEAARILLQEFLDSSG